MLLAGNVALALRSIDSPSTRLARRLNLALITWATLTCVNVCVSLRALRTIGAGYGRVATPPCVPRPSSLKDQGSALTACAGCPLAAGWR